MSINNDSMNVCGLIFNSVEYTIDTNLLENKNSLYFKFPTATQQYTKHHSPFLSENMHNFNK